MRRIRMYDSAFKAKVAFEAGAGSETNLRNAEFPCQAIK